MNKPLLVTVSIIVSVVIYLSIWYVFIQNGNIPTGDGLTKRDWLSFLGGYLAFIGTMFLGLVAVWQTKKANDMANDANIALSREWRPYLAITDISAIQHGINVFSVALTIKNVGKCNVRYDLEYLNMYIGDEKELMQEYKDIFGNDSDFYEDGILDVNSEGYCFSKRYKGHEGMGFRIDFKINYRAEDGKDEYYIKRCVNIPYPKNINDVKQNIRLWRYAPRNELQEDTPDV